MTTIAIIASGPSLTPEQVNYLRGRVRVIAVSDNYRLAPWADWVYSSCKPWWDVHRDAVAASGCMAELWTQDAAAAAAYGLNRLPHRPNATDLVDGTCAGASSGEHAMHLAAHLGATSIVLVGFDMGATGRGHWFGDHPRPLVNGADFGTMRRSIADLSVSLAARGIEVVNCTRSSALTCFPKMELALAC